ncbi:LacI family DNA-binding transcriptional regulator [Trueperella pyogenes]
MGKRKDVTIYDIARVAGVAPSTVSRAFTSPSRVSAKTLGRIHAVARDLGFHAEGSTYWDEQDPTALGIVLRNLANPVYSDILEGFQAGAKREGYSVIVVASNRSLRQEELAVDAIVTNVAGIAFPASRLSQRALSRFERTLPIVLVNRVSPGYTCVVADIAGGMTTTFEHLTSLGHREILYLSGSDESWVNAMRWRMICEIAPLFNQFERAPSQGARLWPGERGSGCAGMDRPSRQCRHRIQRLRSDRLHAGTTAIRLLRTWRCVGYRHRQLGQLFAYAAVTHLAVLGRSTHR